MSKFSLFLMFWVTCSIYCFTLLRKFNSGRLNIHNAMHFRMNSAGIEKSSEEDFSRYSSWFSKYFDKLRPTKIVFMRYLIYFQITTFPAGVAMAKLGVADSGAELTFIYMLAVFSQVIGIVPFDILFRSSVIRILTGEVTDEEYKMYLNSEKDEDDD